MKYWIVVSLVILAAACARPQKTPYLRLKPVSSIKGDIELYFLSEEYLLFDVATQNKNNSGWSFRRDTVPEGIYQLRVDNNAIARLVISSGMPFLISGNFKPDSLSLEIINNEETKALWDAMQMMNELEMNIKEVANDLPDSLKQEDFILYKDSLYDVVDNLIEDKRHAVDNLRKEYKSSLLPLLLMDLKAGNHFIYHPERNADDYYETMDYLVDRYPDYHPVISFSNKVGKLKRWNDYNSITKPGAQMPVISIPDAWGKMVSTGNLTGKPMLYVIWKSTDAGSRIQTKKLMRWTRRYRAKGLKICMISLDSDKEAWLKAIKEDRLSVLHLSDLKGDDSPVPKQLGLSDIPVMLLVNRDGTIAKRTTELEKLQKSIGQIIKN